ncbi:MAG: T9SS type A sorting domain-containing protein [Candidatus Marinimicrobia bacterium]|nr:T9SS type A sorting domain-containing protein [Candidatus Neomarinimicrobiota bacterium]
MNSYFYLIAILGLTSLLSKGQGASISEPVTTVEYTRSIRSILDNNANYPDNGHYLIITPPDWEVYLDPLVNWKLRKGHPVTVVTTENTGTTAPEIQTYLQSAMDSWVNPPVYLLLIGDEDVGVPCYFIADPEHPNTPQFVTEHPYTLLLNDDMYPDLFVGRLTVDTLSELLVVINKILLYEKTPYMDGPDWLNRALMLCTVIDVASPQSIVNWARRKMLDYGYTQIDTSYDPMQNDMESVVDPINSGVGFVNYRGTGSPYGFWVGGRNFWAQDVESLSNGPMLPIVTVMTCGAGSYGGGAEIADPSIGESLLRAGTIANPKGAVAYIGPSSTNTHTEYNNIMNIGFYSALFDQGLYTLGEALWSAKLEMWNNYGDGVDRWSQSAVYYHHLYNIQGDPGMQVRKRMPAFLNVSHPDSICNTADNITIQVTDSYGEPVSAYVCVYDQDTPIGKSTNGETSIILPVNTETADSLQVTITGPDLYPYLHTIPIVSSDESLSITEWSINDDLLVAGDSISISLTVFNPDSGVGSTNLTLTPENSDLFSFDNLRFALDSIPSNGNTTIQRSLSGMVLETVDHGSTGDLTLTLYGPSGSSNSFKPLIVQAPHIKVLESQISSDSIASGDTISYSVQLRNSGGVSTGPIWIKPISNEWLSFLSDTLTFDQIEIDETLLIEEQMIAEVSDQYYDGQTVNVIYEIGYGHLVDTISSDLPIGGAEPYAPSAPDAYGYYVFDLNDQSFSKAPSFDWVELDTALGGPGAPIELFDLNWEQDASIVISLPFEVNYYGESYNTATVCSNGWLAFGSSPEVSFHNRTIPSPSGPIAMVAPYWDDLIYDGIAVYQYNDTVNSRFIIEWSGVESIYVNEPFSFQVIIYDTEMHSTPTGDADILFQYLEFEDSILRTNYCTIGIESPDYSTGSLVSYNNEWFSNVNHLQDMNSVLFTTDRGLRIAPTSIKSFNPAQPMKYSLLPPYPNPGNASFTIRFLLEDMSSAQIKIFNLLGQEINDLEIGIVEPGSHKVMWNGQDYSGRNVSSGIYLIQLQTSFGMESHKVVVLK